MPTFTRDPLVFAAVQAFKEVTGLDASMGPPPAGTHFVASVEIDLGRGVRRPVLAVENIDRQERLVAIASTIALRQAGKFLLVTSHLTPKLVQACRELRLDALDQSGNAVLEQGKNLIMIAGRARIAHGPHAKMSAWSKGSMRAVLALMIKPQLLKEGYRSIATFAGTSVGTAHTAVRGLVARRDLIPKSDGSYIFSDLERLLHEWVVVYPSILRGSLALGRYRAAESDWWAHALPHSTKWQFGGEVAAALMTDYLKPATVTVYCMDGIPKDMLRSARLRPDPGGNVEFLRAPVALRPLNERLPHVVDPLLVYADLLASNDSRNVETARMLREKYIAI
jgi:hypothetical protein